MMHKYRSCSLCEQCGGHGNNMVDSTGFSKIEPLYDKLGAMIIKKKQAWILVRNFRVFTEMI